MNAYHRKLLTIDETPVDRKIVRGISHVKHNMNFKDEISNIKHARHMLDNPLPEHQRVIFKMNTHRELYREEDVNFKRVLSTYIKHINVKYGVLIDENELFSEMLRHDIVTLKLKDKFNLVRPHQMAKILGIDFDYEQNVSATTPSFPSGHAAQGMMFVVLMKERAPKVFEDAEEYEGLVRYGIDMGNRRIYAGLHYPSDNVGALKMLELLKVDVEDIKNMFNE
jgi:hypothetical protein